MKKILITGGAGFIGSYLVRYWLKSNPSVQITNLDKLTYCGDLSRLKDISPNNRYRFIKADICNAKAVDAAIRGCDTVVHLAAESHVDRSLMDAKAFIDTNFYGTYVLLEAARRHGVQKFLCVSTDEVYGSRPTGFFKESDPLNATSPYSISKAAADRLVLSYAESYGLHTLVTRGANTFGPYQYPEKVIPLFVSRLLSGQKVPLYGDGRQVRNWIHVEDHCRAILKVLEKGRKGEAYNVSSPLYLDNWALTRLLLKTLGRDESFVEQVRDRVGHDRRYAINASKLRALGWKPALSGRSDICDTVDWYKRHESWWRRIQENGREFKNYYMKAYASR